MFVRSTNATFPSLATWAAHPLNRPEPRSTLPSFQMFRTVSDRTIGVAPLALVSATYFRMYHPKVCTTSSRWVSWLWISCVSSPRPGSDPRA